MNSTEPVITMPVWQGATSIDLGKLGDAATRYPSVALVSTYRRWAVRRGRQVAAREAPVDYIRRVLHTVRTDGGAVAETDSPWWGWELTQGSTSAPPYLTAGGIRTALVDAAREAGITVQTLPLSTLDVTALLGRPARVRVTRLRDSKVMLATAVQGAELRAAITQIAGATLPEHANADPVWQALMHSPGHLLRGAGSAAHVVGAAGIYDVVVGIGEPHQVRDLGRRRTLWAYAGLAFVVVNERATITIHGGRPLVSYDEPTPSGEIRTQLPEKIETIPAVGGERQLRALRQAMERLAGLGASTTV